FAGKEQLALADMHANALAVDPASGNLWALRGTGRIDQGSLDVYDPKGEHLASYPHYGWDLSYDRKSRAFWLAEKNLLKLDLEGKVLFEERITEWCASSLAVNQSTGTVWVTTRHHSQALGQNALLAF